MRSYFILLCILSLSSCSSSHVTPHPDDLGQVQIEVNIPQPERWVLDNGLVVLYLHDDELPVMKGKLMFSGGSLFEPEESVGLASIAGGQLREGGVKGLGPEQLDRLLDSIGASIESGFGDEFGNVSFSCLSEDFDKVFSLFSRVIREPAFDSGRLELAKKLAHNAVQRRRDNPELMSHMAFGMLTYGEDSPYSRASTPKSIKGITVQDLRIFSSRYIKPKGARLAISGSIPKRQVKNAIDRYFASWEAKKQFDYLALKYPAVEATARPGIYVLERDFDQTSIVMGHLGPARLGPDMYNLAVYNKLFGYGGWGSTLFSEIRSKLGLAYSVYGGFSEGPVAGSYRIVLQTRTSEALNAIEKVMQIIDDSRNVPPEQVNYDEAKLQIKRGFVFKFPNPSSVVTRKAVLELLNYPDNYDEVYLGEISDVSSAGMLAAAKQHVKPSDLGIVIVGNISAEEVRSFFKGAVSVYTLGFDDIPYIQRQ